MSDITAVILAAGANERLKGIVPSYMKPLVLVNGRPLIQHALEHARRWEVTAKIIVASPANISLMAQVVEEPTYWAVQSLPRGVSDAVRRALPYVKTTHTLILCADNTFEDALNELSPSDMLRQGVRPLFGARVLPVRAAARFTRYRLRMPGPGVHLIEASSPDTGDGCWIGPLLLETKCIQAVLDEHGNPTVSQLILESTNDGKDLLPMPMRCADLGIPDALA
jgi:hypothetical protein